MIWELNSNLIKSNDDTSKVFVSQSQNLQIHIDITSFTRRKGTCHPVRWCY